MRASLRFSARLLSVFLLCISFSLQAAVPDGSARALHLLGYIGADYPRTVMAGEVTRINGEADLQRNTLQAKVKLLAPPDVLRPEMLSRVEFLALAPGSAVAAEPGSGPAPAAVVLQPAVSLSLFVPENAFGSDGTVWVCDRESRRVEPRKPLTTGVRRDGFAEVKDGVRPGEWVVLLPTTLRAGQRVKPELVAQP